MRNIYQKPSQPSPHQHQPQYNQPHFAGSNIHQNAHSDQTSSVPSQAPTSNSSSYLINKNSPCHPSNYLNTNGHNAKLEKLRQQQLKPASSHTSPLSLYNNTSLSNYQNVSAQSNEYENHVNTSHSSSCTGDSLIINSPVGKQVPQIPLPPTPPVACGNPALNAPKSYQQPPQSPLSKPPPLPPQIYSSNMQLKSNSAHTTPGSAGRLCFLILFLGILSSTVLER
jgi:hypothetical protein